MVKIVPVGVVILAAFALILCSSALALAPDRRISQYAHTAWRIQDGFFSGTPQAITQTADGYLWIGTEAGLVRFDGISFVPWTSPNGELLPSSRIHSLLGTSDGSLWIGTSRGLARWSKGELFTFPGAPAFVEAIVQDSEGTVWMTRSQVRDAEGALCEVAGNALRCHGTADGIPFPYAQPLFNDVHGNLWIGSSVGVCRWKSGNAKTYIVKALMRVQGLAGVSAIAPGDDGSVLVGMRQQGEKLGLQELREGVWRDYILPGLDGPGMHVSSLLRDREGDLWLGTANNGLYRVHAGHADHFGSADGLSSDAVQALYEDRESDLWVATSRGIDRFRDTRVVTYSIREGLSSEDVDSVLASRDGTVWIGNLNALDVLRHDRVDGIGRANGLPGTLITSLFEDQSGRVWVGVDSGLTLYQNGRFRWITKSDGAPLGVVTAIAEDVDHNLWVATTEPAFFRIQNLTVREEIKPPQIPRVLSLAADPKDGIWLGLSNGNLGRYQRGQLDIVTPNRPGNFPVRNLLVDSDDSAWWVTQEGLFRWKTGRVGKLNSHNGLPCDDMFSLVRDGRGSLWLDTQCGLVAIDSAELERWWQQPDLKIRMRTLDVFDGAQPGLTNFRPEVSRAPDGKLWFANENILQMVDPERLEGAVRSEDMALKFLPDDVAHDPKAQERFEREARAASTLDHPNICTIHEFGEYEGHPFIAMALLDGQTLHQRMDAESGPLRTSELLSLAIQIADGLAAAHEKGIIHRDIKPANVFVTNRDEAKILDFGLAKLTRVPEGNGVEPEHRDAATQTLQLSVTGVAIGTAPYMSPEQVRGEKLDARTDLFSLGLIIYEMATGKRAFPEDTVANVHDAILSGTPIPVRKLNPSVPSKLEEIVNKALEKDREVRCQSASEIRADLKRLKRDLESSATLAAAKAPLVSKPKPANNRLAYGAVLALVIIGVGLRWYWLRGQHSAPHRVLSERQLTHNSPANRALSSAISPDGKYLIYVDTNGLHLNVIDTAEVYDIPIPAELRAGLWDVAWFPDSSKVLINVASKDEGFQLWVVSVFGGSPRKLRDFARAAAVSPQGDSIAFVSHGSEVWTMGANGENPKKILTSDAGSICVLAWSPTGGRVAYIQGPAGGEGGKIENISAQGGEPVAVLSDARLSCRSTSPLEWIRGGRLIFSLEERTGSDEANLWSIDVDPRTGKSLASRERVTNWHGVTPWLATVSADGKRLVVTKARFWDDVYVGGLRDDGKRLDSPKRFTLSDTKDYPDAWTPDSQSIVFESDRTGNNQLFQQSLDHLAPEPLVRSPDDEEGAVICADGPWILYWAYPQGQRPIKSLRLMRSRLTGGAADQVLQTPWDRMTAIMCPSRSGASCVLSRLGENDDVVFDELDPMRGLGKELARTHQPTGTAVSESPDGTRIAVSGGTGIRLIDLHGGAERELPLRGVIWSLSWAPDSKALYAALQDGDYQLVQIRMDGKTTVLLNQGRNQWLSNATVSPDGRHLAYSQQSYDTNSWLLENF
jgi:serine/threonine protein kinase/Tol biopolymer transport system component